MGIHKTMKYPYRISVWYSTIYYDFYLVDFGWWIRKKNISVVEKYLQIFGFSYYILIIYLSFDENSEKSEDKK
jgi:hypothetical protein